MTASWPLDDEVGSPDDGEDSNDGGALARLFNQHLAGCQSVITYVAMRL